MHAVRVEGFLRDDVVFLLERFFYFLEVKREHGVLVMDETDKREDRRFVARMEEYFTKTATGRYRAAWIVPTPFFVSSDMAYAVQAADLCIYCINWGFRLVSQGMNAERRDEITDMFRMDLADLQYVGRDTGRPGIRCLRHCPCPRSIRAETGSKKKEATPRLPFPRIKARAAYEAEPP